MGYVAVREAGQSHAALLDQLNRWCLTRLTALNRDILDGRSPRSAFGQELDHGVLSPLPAAEAFSPEQARQLLVLLGLVGASVGRHYQEADTSHRATPELAFAGLRVGADHAPFLSYFAELAERSGTGHGPRDSYASLVRWNLPAVEVRWADQLVTGLPSAFTDGLARSYTGAPDETRFFGLLKASEVLEHAVNQELLPLADGLVELRDDEAIRRIRRSIALLDALRALSHDFTARSSQEGLRVGYFMDVFRQFAVHWTANDVPPSGALDAEALIRDLLVGIDLPNYPDHLHRVFPGLLTQERSTLTRLMGRESLPVLALRLAGLDAARLAAASPSEIHRLVVRNPILTELYLLLNAHARAAGVHLRMSKLFLFNPQRERDSSGQGDPGVVSNRTGTTGMDETRLELLTRVRHHHPLAPLHDECGRREAGPPVAGPWVRFVGSRIADHDLGLPDRHDDALSGHDALSGEA